jgi:chromosome segregation ATPase
MGEPLVTADCEQPRERAEGVKIAQELTATEHLAATHHEMALAAAVISLVDENTDLRDRMEDLQTALTVTRNAAERRGQQRDDAVFLVNTLREEISDLRAERDALRERLAEVEGALRQLVDLKDGPRDSAYYASKDAAWGAARAALSGAVKP